MRTYTNITDTVTAIVSKALTLEQIEIDKDLFESGLLDSMSLMQLMMELEEGFEITITPEELDVEDYRTVRTMSKMIIRLTLVASLNNLHH
ncbi:MAG: acyl carrier protein [Balneolaceae bacterium]|nr:acyl carrier protein [Balneolaceae bacterium]